MKALPVEESEIGHLPRDYIASIILSIVGQPFSDWVDDRIAERNDQRKSDKNMDVALDPDLAKIFKESNAVSISKGISSNMMKVSKQAFDHNFIFLFIN